MALRRSQHTSSTSPPPHTSRLKHRSTRAFTRVSATLLACTLPFMGVTAANAAPIDGLPSIGDSLFTGIGNTGYDVKHYDVQLNYVHEATADRAAGSVVATTTITAVADAELATFSLDFEHQGVDSVSVNGVPVTTYSQSSDKPTEAYKLYITPATPVTGEFSVTVEYSGILPRHIDNDGSSEGWVATPNGVIALGQPVGTMAWLPSNNTPADKATFNVALTVPTTMNGLPASGVSNGNLVSKTPSADGLETTWVWQQPNQQATMSTMLGIGNYDVYENDITLTDGTVIPEWTFVDSTLTEEQKATTEERRQRIEEITHFLEEKYGRYPGTSTGIIVHKSDVGYALETQDRSYFPGVPSLGTLVHEMAHQWFGAAVTPNDWNNIWMSEGQASYASTMFTEEVAGGTSTADSYFNTWNRFDASQSRWAVAPAAMTDQVELFGWQTYTRGGMTYEALRQVMGDKVFFDFLTEWAQSNNGTSRSTADLIALAEEMSGRDLTAFFQDWLYDADKPAWPSTWELNLSSDPVASEVDRGTEITYTLEATNTGKVNLDGQVTVNLADVLDDAVLDGTSLDPSLSLAGSILTWTVPETTGTESSTVSFTVAVNDRAYEATIAAVAEGTLGAQCVECAVTHTTAAVPEVGGTDLTTENRGTISVPETASPGDFITVSLGSEAFDSSTVSTTLFSTATPLGESEVANGSYQILIPANATLGAHRIAVFDSIGLLIGWDEITLVAPPVKPVDPAPTPPATGKTDPLSVTGSGDGALWMMGGAATLLLIGGAALAIARRRATVEQPE